MKQWILSLACGSLLAGVGAAQARVIDSFETSGAGSSGVCTAPASGSSTSIPIPNSFPPGSDPLGVIGSTSITTAERRFDTERNGTGGPFSFEFNSGSSPGQLIMDVGPGCLFEATGTYDGIGTP